MDHRALLRESERRVFRGETEHLENPDAERRKARHRLSKRLETLAEDMALLDEHAPEQADAVREVVCGEFEQRLMRLQEDLEEFNAEREQSDGE
jgi:hypothetical protein